MGIAKLGEKYYGEDVAKEFKCSPRWLTPFKGYWGISSRRRTEKKSEPMERKLPRVRRWHARLRLRLDRQGWFEGKVHGRNLNARDLARAPTANFSVRYSKSLTVGVKKKKIIPLCHVAHELTSRTYGEKKWWVVIVKDQ